MELLTNLDGLSSLRIIDDKLVVSDNDALVDVSGLEGLTSIGGFVLIFLNDALTDAVGQALVDTIGEENIGGSINISANGP